MSAAFQITIRDEEHTKYLTQLIKEKAGKLQHYSYDIIKCRIVVDANHHNQQHGNLHTVHIELIIPQDEIVVNKVANENVYVAIHEAFAAACRQLQDMHKKKLLRRRHS